MFRVEVNGRAARFDTAVAESVRLLLACKLPLIAGLGGDIAAVRKCILIAERLRGVFDHSASDVAMRNLDVMQRSGWMVVSPGEVARSCDLLLQVGPAAGEIRLPDAASRIAASPDDIPVIRMLVRGVRPKTAKPDLIAIADSLKASKFGVATWSASHLTASGIEMLMGLVRDLNETTRFSSLPMPGPDNAAGAAQAAAWMTGFPLRVSFGRGYPEFDPWAFAADRLIASGESDGVLWLSSYRPSAPDWKSAVPMIAITAPGAKFKKKPQVLFEVGSPGRDHDAVDYRPETMALAPVTAASPTAAPQAAAILEQIIGGLP